MPRGKKHTPEQIVRLLRDAEASLVGCRYLSSILGAAQRMMFMTFSSV